MEKRAILRCRIIGILYALLFIGMVFIPSLYSEEYANSWMTTYWFCLSTVGMLFFFTAGLKNNHSMLTDLPYETKH